MTGEQLNPTRMELIRVKERITLARKGYQLLKQKRDILLIELMSSLHSTVSLRDRINEQMSESYDALWAAQSYHSGLELETLAMASSREHDVRIAVRNVMGVRLPSITRTRAERRIKDRGYGLVYTSAKIDEAAEGFEKSLELILEAAEKETSVKRLLVEIEKTKRRVNALDYVVLPWLQDTRREITLKLDEIERYDLVTLKTVKRHLEELAIRTPQG